MEEEENLRGTSPARLSRNTRGSVQLGRGPLLNLLIGLVLISIVYGVLYSVSASMGGWFCMIMMFIIIVALIYNIAKGMLK